jgi:hypothetical protein
LLIAASCLLGASTTGGARRTDLPRSQQLKQTKSLPAALAMARRDGSAPEIRLPAFSVPDVNTVATPVGVVAERCVVDRPGCGLVCASSIAARGPPRG